MFHISVVLAVPSNLIDLVNVIYLVLHIPNIFKRICMVVKTYCSMCGVVNQLLAFAILYNYFPRTELYSTRCFMAKTAAPKSGTIDHIT